MNTFYILFSFLNSLSILIMIYAFYRDFKKLTLMQKISISLVSLSGLTPMIVGAIESFFH